MEECWKAVKPYKLPVKGSNNYYDYGCLNRTRRLCDGDDKRRHLRSMKKLGFDYSECWSLDCTIMAWLADNVGGFFKDCGPSFNWDAIDLDGNEWPVNEDYNSEESKKLLKKCQEASQLRYNSYLEHLRNLLDNCELELYDAFRDFVVPRLRYLAKHVHGWPAGDDFKDYEDWINAINEMADAFERGERYDERFITNFWNLWD